MDSVRAEHPDARVRGRVLPTGRQSQHLCPIASVAPHMVSRERLGQRQ